MTVLNSLPSRLLGLADLVSDLAYTAWWLRHRAPRLLEAIRHGEPDDLDFFGAPRPGPRPQRRR